MPEPLTPEERSDAMMRYLDHIGALRPGEMLPKTKESVQRMLDREFAAAIRDAEESAAMRAREACELKAADQYVMAEPMTEQRRVARSIADAIRALPLSALLGRDTKSPPESA